MVVTSSYRILIIVLIGIGFQAAFAQANSDRGEFFDSRDGRTFKTIRIGDQVWLAENFAYLPFICRPDSANCGAVAGIGPID